ncbi:MAG TPA: penicillin-binding transpeptidase domain-containing protein [Clostridia bacterium]|nr:penicillin-binding transpeptidase domain-containing protein [Clostridia bacterium]
MKLSGRRIVAMALLVIFILTGFSVRLARYQIVEGADYREQSQKVTIQSSEIEAPRGEILDRYGRVLASNKVGYSIYLQKAFFPSTKQPVKQNNVINSICKILSQKGESWNDSLPISKTAPYCFNAKNTSDLKKLRSLLNVSDKVGASDIMKKLVSRYHLEGNSSADQRTLAGIRYEMEIRDFTYSNPYEFASSVSIDTVTKIKERSTSLPGVEIREVPTRVYPDGTIAPHVIGTVGPIYAEQYAALKKKGYSMNDTVGKDGIEYTMESYLRGTKGEQTIEMDSMGNVTSTNITTKANPGDNVVLTIDSDLQKLVQSSLQSTIQNIASTAKSVKWGSQAKSGAAVVLDIKTGEVLAMANYPSYDLNTYKKDYSALSNDSANPLLNRCVTGSYRPGSTFKPITAISGPTVPIT